MTVYSYNAQQLKKKTDPKKRFWSAGKIAIAAGSGFVVAFGALIATAPAPVVTESVTQTSPTVNEPTFKSGYNPATNECVLRDGSGSLVNFNKPGDTDSFVCEEHFAKYNLQDYAKAKKDIAPDGLIASNKFDMAVLSAAYEKADREEAAASAQRMENYAIQSAQAQQANQDKCWDQLESRGYGDASCY